MHPKDAKGIANSVDPDQTGSSLIWVCTVCPDLRLVRTACKALARGADEKSGKHKNVLLFSKDFLKDNDMTSLPLQTVHGNRFNILFGSSAAVFFLKDKIIEFLAGNQSNGLLKAVCHDMNVPEYLAGVKALGLISWLITRPLWTLIEDRNIHVLDMNAHYLQMVNFFSDAVQCMESFMKGEMKVFGESTVIKNDAIINSVIMEWEHDAKVQIYISVLLPALSELTTKIFVDHLPGGKWDNVSNDLGIRQKSSSTAKHNKYCESVFGYLDQLLRK